MAFFLSAGQIARAREVLARHLAPTRLVRAPSLGSEVWLKLETEQPTGSFKVRGAICALAARLEREPVREVVASSTGNHGAAVAYAARLFGVPARIFLPSGANPVKRKTIESLGAGVVEEGNDLAAAFERARDYAASTGAYLLNDATDPHLPAGPATIAMEIFDELPDVGGIYVPVGDTALIRGVAAAARLRSPATRIIGVQAEGAPAYTLSWREGRAIATDVCGTIADGLATRTPEEENVRAIAELVSDMLLVSDDELLAAIRHLSVRERVIAEPAGAAATAAFLRYRERAGTVVLLVTGVNLAPDVRERAFGR